MKAPTLADRLRAETRDEHEAIEGTVGLMSPTVDRSEYQRYLERTYGFLAPLEGRLHELLTGASDEATAMDWSKRDKVPALERDLRALGADDAALAAIPRAQGFVEALDQHSAWGVAYVLEGSTLGGRLLHRHVSEILGEPLGAYAFLDAYGTETGARWRQFKEAVNAVPAEAHDAVVEAARATFVAMRHFMEGRAESTIETTPA